MVERVDRVEILAPTSFAIDQLGDLGPDSLDILYTPAQNALVPDPWWAVRVEPLEQELLAAADTEQIGDRRVRCDPRPAPATGVARGRRVGRS
jgi:hypothetical protein